MEQKFDLQSIIIEHLPQKLHFIFDFQLFDNTLLSWIFAFLIIFLFIFIRKFLARTLVKPLEALEHSTNEHLRLYADKLHKIISKPLELTIILLGVYISSFFLAESKDLEALLTHLYRSFIIIILTWILYRATDTVRAIVEENIIRLNYDLGASLTKLVSTILKVFMVVMAMIAVMNEWGFNTTQIIAAFSVLSVGASISAQDTIKNFWASLVLFFDKPFKIGDWIELSGINGIVEEIGIRSTRIRTFEKSLITVPNGTVANANIQNWDKRPKRRVKMNLGLTYSTSPEQMEAILNDIRNYLKSNDKIHQEQILVYFTEFGDSSLNIMCYYFTKSIIWAEWLAAREETYLEFIRIVQRNGSSVAFPSQSVYIESVPEELRGLDMKGSEKTV